MTPCRPSSTHARSERSTSSGRTRSRPRDGRGESPDPKRRVHYSRQRRYDYLFTVVNPPELDELEEALTPWLGEPSHG